MNLLKKKDEVQDLKILFISGRGSTYSRNSVIIKGLKAYDVEIIDCTGSSSGSHFGNSSKALLKFILKKTENFDLIYIGFLGHHLVPIIKKLSNKPIMFDAFISTYDTMCFDRKKFKPNSLRGRFYYWLDKRSCELADIVLLDTDAHIDYFVNTFNLNREKFRSILVGSDDSIFYPIDTKRKDNKFRVFYYATYLPLHGIEYIVKAVKKLETYEDIEFEIVGKGIEHKKIMDLTEKLNVKNIKFIDWIPYEELPLEIAKADVCLGGHFSDIDKAKRVISIKAFDFIAMKKPVILGDNRVNRELFEDKKNALLVEHANADALADAILELKDDESLREKIAEKGYRIFKERCTPEIIGKEIKGIMREVL